MRFFILVTAVFVCGIHTCFGEIELITVKWAQGYCTKNCQEGLRTRLKSVPPIAEFNVQGEGSQVQIRWKPKAPFSYLTLNMIIKGFGIHIDQVFMRVRGVIERDARHTYLVSLGDNTRFILLSPINVSPLQSQSVARNNVESYQLAVNLKERFLLDEQEYRVVTVQGNLFDPWRYVENYLIVQSASSPPPLVKPHVQ